MGANSSARPGERQKAKHQNGHHKGQDVVRGPRPTTPSENRLGSHVPVAHHGNTKAMEPKASIHTDIPQHKHSPKMTAQHRQQTRTPEQHLRRTVMAAALHSQRAAAPSDSEDEDYLDVPVIIRSTPDLLAYDRVNMGNVRMTKDNPRFSAAPNGQPSSNGQAEVRRYHPARHLLVDESNVRRGSDVTGLSRANVSKRIHGEQQQKTKDTQISLSNHHKLESPRTSEPAIIADHRVQPQAQTRRDDSSDRPSEPKIDYDDTTGADKDGNRAAESHRMGTLEYFNQLPREHAMLRGFEKAKPAGNIKSKVNSPAMGRARQPKSTDMRPKSMFVTNNIHASNPDIFRSDSDQSGISSTQRSFDSNQDDVIPNQHRNPSHRSTMDDTDYETLSRRKRVAGQRLAVGILDKETESKFLKSLKRNLRLMNVRRAEEEEARVTRSTENMVF